MQTLTMNDVATTELPSPGAVGTPRPTFLKSLRFLRQRPELIFFVVLIAIFNVSVLFGRVWSSMVFQPEAVRAGEWWRLVTHPFVHLTWYHLLLDGTAFLSLYCSLSERRIFARLAYVIAAAAGSLVASWVASPEALANGLCGLSGVAHGLMAISAIEMLGADKTGRRIGWICLVLVVGKATFEAITGRMFFGFLDFGLLGSPVAVSHAGGIVGGLAMILLFRFTSSQPKQRRV
jgi:rhomboid family GlyGly-CTERM serine protease